MLCKAQAMNDRKSFFAVAESEKSVDNFMFREKPIVLPDLYPDETNVYDMRYEQPDIFFC